MPDSGVSLSSSNGESAETVILRLRQTLTPKQEHLLLAGQGQNTRIHERTAQGVDVDGVPFEPYNTTRPYYYRPWDTAGIGRARGRTLSLAERRGRVPEASRIRSAQHFLRRLGGSAARGSSLHSHTLHFKGALVASISHKEGDTIRFESYAAFKASLGRGGVVDLTGPRAPHMMQMIQVSAGDDYIRLSIEDPEKAAIGTGHNTGTARGGKRRHFFGASEADGALMIQDIRNAMLSEVK